MSTTLLIAIAVNATILLVLSWAFGIHIISKLHAEKTALEEALGTSSDSNDTDDSNLYAMIEQMKQEIQEKEAIIASLIAEDDDEANAEMIQALQNDLKISRNTLKNMEKELESGQGLSSRIAYLEKAERRLRDENKQMRTTGMQLAEKLDTRNQQINHLKDTNAKLKKTIKTLSTASKEQMELIQKLQKQVDRSQELENYQRNMISDLEGKLENALSEQGDSHDQEKVDEIEKELDELRDKLKRTLIEKEFIEGHLLELDNSLEKAKETEEALKRAQEEIAKMEKQFPDYTPSSETTAEDSTPKPSMADMDMHEMEAIDVDNMLFEPLESFWNTLEGVSALELHEEDNMQMPNDGEWATITIGDNEYTLLINMSQQLAENLSSSIVKEETDGSSLACLEMIGKIMAQPLADDMVNNQIQAAENIDSDTVVGHVKAHRVIAEMLATTAEETIYAVLTSSQED